MDCSLDMLTSRASRAELAESVRACDWECADANTQYLTHPIHRYSGKFIPQVARNAIELLTRPGDVVLDPYCGSGTTLLECMILNRRAIGFDLNPLAVLIAQSKTHPVSRRRLHDCMKSLKQAVSRLPLHVQDLLSPDAVSQQTVLDDWRWSDAWYRKWFHHEILWELIALDHLVGRVKDQQFRCLCQVAFSDILRKSSNAHKGYPNVMFDKRSKQPPPATPRFIRRLTDIVEAAASLEHALGAVSVPTVLRANATSMPIASCSVDAIITHPPYIGSIPYAEYGMLSLAWLGHDPKQLDATLTGGRRQSRDVVERFILDFRQTLIEAHRVLRPNGHLFMLLGSPIVKGKRVDLPDLAAELATSVGFSLAARAIRNGVNRRANLMGHETLLFLSK